MKEASFILLAIRVRRHNFIGTFGEEAPFFGYFREEAPFYWEEVGGVFFINVNAQNYAEFWLDFHSMVHALPSGLVI